MVFAVLLAASAGQPQVVAVLEFRDKVPAAERIDAAYVSDQVRSAVKETLPQAKVITRENMLVLLQASGKKLEECEGECEVDTGRRIGADLVVSGELLRFGTQYKLNMKLHDTRSGELLSGAVASGAAADDLDRALRPAVEKLLAALRPEAFQDRLSDQRAAAGKSVEETGPRFSFAAHGVAGYGNVSGGSSIVTLPLATSSAVATALALGAGVDAGVHLDGTWSLAAFGEYSAVTTDTFVNLLAGGVLARARLGRPFSLSLGAGAARLSSSVAGWAVLAGADYQFYGPLAAHAQLLVANQSSSAGLFSGGDEVVCLAAGLSLLY